METASTSPTTKPLYRGTQIVWYILAVIEILLLTRFILKFLAANPDATFTSLIYRFSAPPLAPFFAVFGTTVADGSVIEWATLLAMIVYWLFAWLIKKLLTMSRTVSTPEAAEKLKEEEKL